VSDAFLDDVDLVLLDVKSGLPETYRRVTGRDLAPTLAFGRRLADRGTAAIWVRYVLVPGLTDAVDNVDAVADYVAELQQRGPGGVIERVEVLPFHQMGRDKWHQLGLAYQLEDTEPPSAELTERVRGQFRARGLTVY
jgi:pyruvate formate lyase activating enzyme